MVPGWVQIAVVVLLAVLLFGGRGKISSIMGDFAKGIKSFKKGMKDEDLDTAAKVEKSTDEIVDVTPSKEKA
jgi:sec-independent protein translocase protein TatA